MSKGSTRRRRAPHVSQSEAFESWDRVYGQHHQPTAADRGPLSPVETCPCLLGAPSFCSEHRGKDSE